MAWERTNFVVGALLLKVWPRIRATVPDHSHRSPVAIGCGAATFTIGSVCAAPSSYIEHPENRRQKIQPPGGFGSGKTMSPGHVSVSVPRAPEIARPGGLSLDRCFFGHHALSES